MSPGGRDRAVKGALGAILLLGAANFVWQLGAINYFADEVLSIWNTTPSLSHVIAQVNRTESNPWTYFVLLHEWLGHTGAGREWSTRLPSVLAGIALIAAVFWLARALLPRAAALGAAALTAISPLVLQYAQQVRMYVFVMLAVTLAAGAAIRAPGQPERRKRLLVLGSVASVAALWLHYFAVLVIGPLCVWVAVQHSLTRRQRIAFLATSMVAELLTLPVFIEQSHNTGGLHGIADLSLTNVLYVLGSPFGGRFNSPTWLQVAGAAVVVLACVRLASADRGLLAALALVPVALLIAIGIGGKPVVSTRYSSVGVTLIIVAVAAAVATLPKTGALLASLVTVFLATYGTLISHSKPGFYPESEQIMAYISRHRQPADSVAFGLRQGIQWPFEYYGTREMHPPPSYIEPGDLKHLDQAFRRRQRVWLITQAPPRHYTRSMLIRSGTLFVQSYGYRVADARSWTTAFSYIASLAVPR